MDYQKQILKIYIKHDYTDKEQRCIEVVFIYLDNSLNEIACINENNI